MKRKEILEKYKRDANLRNADLSNVNLSNVNLSSADLWNANLRNANLRNASLWNADLSYADLRNAGLSYVDLSYADLRNAGLGNADLWNANLSYADLSYADLSYADLWNADLSNANLSYADLRNAGLRNVNLGYADLSYAILWNVNLSNVNLRNADLSNAKNLPSIYKSELNILNFQKGKLRAFKYLNGNESPYKSFEYKIGKTYICKDFDDDERKLCSKGFNVATLDWCLRDTDCDLSKTYVIVEFDVKDIVAIPYNSEGKFRVKKIRIIRKLKKKELEKAIKPFYENK